MTLLSIPVILLFTLVLGCYPEVERSDDLPSNGEEGMRKEAGGELDQDCFNCKCRRNIDPECGSDSRTYLNHCMFECAQSRCPGLTRGVTVRKGRCEDNTPVPRRGGGGIDIVSEDPK